jgi:hypothetical protein
VRQKAYPQNYGAVDDKLSPNFPGVFDTESVRRAGVNRRCAVEIEFDGEQIEYCPEPLDIASMDPVLGFGRNCIA